MFASNKKWMMPNVHDIIVLLPISKVFPSNSNRFLNTIGDDQWHGDKVYVIGQSKRDVGIPSSHVTFLHLFPIHSQLLSTACIGMSNHFWVQVLYQIPKANNKGC